MNTKLILPLAVVGIVLVAGVLWARNSQMQSGDTMNTAETSYMVDDNKMMEGNSFTGSLQELMALGESYTCSFSTTDTETQMTTSGTVYITDAGDSMRGQFTAPDADGVTVQTNIIRDGEYTYVWPEGESQGFKSKIVEVTPVPVEGEDVDNEADESNPEPFDDSQEVTFDCDPWIVDVSMFVPPTDVAFTDFSAQMEVMQQQNTQGESMSGESSGDQCAVCNQIPDAAAKAQCLSALGC